MPCIGIVRPSLMSGVLLVLASLAASVHAADAPARAPVQFGVLMDGPWERNAEILAVFQAEIEELLGQQYDVRFPADSVVTSDHTMAAITVQLGLLLADPGLDAVITLGPLGGHAASRFTALSRPVIAPFVIDHEVQGFPATLNEEGVRVSGDTNFTYIDVFTDPEHVLAEYLDLARFEHLALLASESIVSSLPQLPDSAGERLAAAGLTLSVVPVGSSADAALDAIPDGADAAYVSPLLTLSPGEFDRLVEGLIARRLPSYALWGREDVERGLLFTLTPDTYIPKIARRTALHLQRVLKGEDAGALPLDIELRERRIINMATARAIGVYPRWEILTDAELLDAEPEEFGAPLTLRETIEEAIRANLDLAARDRAVSAGESELARARAAWLPQVDLSVVGVAIDEDRAAASFGAQAERTLDAGPSLGQLLFSEPAAANVSVQRSLQSARVHDRASLRLDIAAEAATAHLDVLRAKTFERIQRENVRRTRSNLELAESRLRIGVSSRAEVYRWESELALEQIEVIDAEARRHLAELRLARLLHRPMEVGDRRIATRDVGLEDPDLLTSGGRIERFVDNPWRFAVFRDYMVREGLAASPELRAVDAAIAARRRLLASARRAYWAPTAALSAEWADRTRSGAGADGGALVDLLPLPPAALPVADDENWSVALSVRIPLYQGGARRADARQAEQELARLLIERDALAERIEQGVRSALHVTGASFASIQLSRDSADAADRNLDLITDAYSRGAVTIIDLLDAQNAALVAELFAANAVYDFIADMISAERAVGGFHVLRSEPEREEFFARLERFYAERGGAVDGSGGPAAPGAPGTGDLQDEAEER